MTVTGFDCGHSHDLKSNRARKRWIGSLECPACWVSSPEIHVYLTRIDITIGSCFEYFPGVRIEVEGRSALGVFTRDEILEEARRSVMDDFRASGLMVRRLPGLDLNDPATMTRIESLVRQIRPNGAICYRGRFGHLIADRMESSDLARKSWQDRKHFDGDKK